MYFSGKSVSQSCVSAQASTKRDVSLTRCAVVWYFLVIWVRVQGTWGGGKSERARAEGSFFIVCHDMRFRAYMYDTCTAAGGDVASQ